MTSTFTISISTTMRFLTDRLAFAFEYRQNPHLMDEVPDLVKAENDWYTLYLAYVINDNMTISGGYSNLGNIANHKEDNCWGLQLKYEF